DRREFSETRWTAMEKSSRQLAAVKFIVEAKGAARSEYRAGMITLECAGAQRARFVYVRGLPSDEVSSKPTINLLADGQVTPLSGSGNVSKMDSIDTGGSFNTWFAYQPLDFFEAAAKHQTIEIVETGPAGAPARITTLSTAGLSQAV